ncbi:hypothetical protein ABFS83_06G137000 [Erythranthe nasuta]
MDSRETGYSAASIWRWNKNRESDDQKPRINRILDRLNQLREDTENKELEVERAEKLKFRINKIVTQLNILQADESGSESESESESETESETESRMYEERDRKLERILEPVEEQTLDSNDPFRLRRPKTKGGEDDIQSIQWLQGGYHQLLYEPALTGKDPKTVEYVRNSAHLAIDSFNKREKTKYRVVDVVAAIMRLCVGQMVQFGFRAMQEGDADVTNFEARIMYGTQYTQVEYVSIC